MIGIFQRSQNQDPRKNEAFPGLCSCQMSISIILSIIITFCCHYKVIYTDGRATRDFTVQTMPETSDQSIQHYPETTEQSCQTNNSKLKEMGTQAGRSIPYDTKLEDILKASIKVHINSSLKNLKLDI